MSRIVLALEVGSSREVDRIGTKTTKRKPAAKATPGKTVDDYIAAAPADKRATLKKLRNTIKAAAPGATELINYGVPMFRLGGKNLVSYAAATAHCTFYVQSPAVMHAFAAELKGYKQGKGSIQFSAEKPLPASLVTRLVKARIAENGKAR